MSNLPVVMFHRLRSAHCLLGAVGSPSIVLNVNENCGHHDGLQLKRLDDDLRVSGGRFCDEQVEFGDFIFDFSRHKVSNFCELARGDIAQRNLQECNRNMTSITRTPTRCAGCGSAQGMPHQVRCRYRALTYAVGETAMAAIKAVE